MTEREGRLEAGAKRSINLDLIRCFAVLMVVQTHFYNHSGYYAQVVEGPVMAVLTLIRPLAVSSVPLFVLLSGYLCIHKRSSLTYYLRIIPILMTYLLACVFTLLFRAVVWKEEVSLMWAISQILKIDQGAVTYAWYIEMYLGLYLLIPYLNLIYQNLETKGQKQGLILVCLALTMVPVSVNVFDFSTPGFWRNPRVSNEFHDLFPSWWTGLWPVTYYFIGAYLREFGPVLSQKGNALLILLCLPVFAVYSMYRSQGTPLFGNGMEVYAGLQCTILSVLLFSLLLRLNTENCPALLGRAAARISKLSLGIYLCSYVTDLVVYRVFTERAVSLPQQLLYMPAAVLSSFLLAAAASQVLNWIQTGLFRGVNKALKRQVL